jgi:hypothetical protein
LSFAHYIKVRKSCITKFWQNKMLCHLR